MICMVDCPTCGWKMTQRREYETGGFVFGHFVCESVKACPTTLKVKSPLDWMVETGRWKSEPLSSKSEK